ncbi:Putative glutamyl/glutaminyl-tRNA synthetase, rossmann-like alpha/beta/alpha sandwich [Septoria linicola]|uniref:glutamate--tRNA ligase n=1 Tax=Septoria linicola TaxID=215465 RepID=A0A9Q9EJ15_9PEZI|nr:Putative glutamyl/glutaminyl-tRNA synthetase, rossmann-like alpha/beta/alpha sandwich [Septoria linicola]
MHIGGLRTALFSYLLAKRTQGEFLLRIEDTDQKRLVNDAEDRLCQDLQWAGLQWDEGPQVGGPYGPYKQSERNDIYQKHAKDLLDSDSAYRCFCTTQTTGVQGGKAAYVTSGCYQDCSSLSSEEAQDRAETKHDTFTIRLKQPADVHKRTYTDLIYGKIQRLKRSPSASQNAEDDSGIDAADTILVKSDGTPTYHFANVVDDHLMKITHVIRGTEWMASTPLHYDLYTAFGWTPPAFAHVGLLVDENKAKLSKRSDAGLVLDVKGMREHNGVLPEVLTNFLALLGWSNPGRNDVLEMQELIRDFDLKFTKGNTIVRMEKLWFLQKQHVARKIEQARTSNDSSPIDNIINAVVREVPNTSFLHDNIGEGNGRVYSDLKTYIRDILLVDSKSYQTPQQFVARNKYFFDYDSSLAPDSPETYNAEHDITPSKLASLADFILTPFIPPSSSSEEPSTTSSPSSEEHLDTHISHTSTLIHARIHASLLDQLSLSDADLAENDHLTQTYRAWNKALMRHLREKLSYGLPGPGIGQIMAVLGYKECCRRLGAVSNEKGCWDSPVMNGSRDRA